MSKNEVENWIDYFVPECGDECMTLAIGRYEDCDNYRNPSCYCEGGQRSIGTWVSPYKTDAGSPENVHTCIKSKCSLDVLPSKDQDLFSFFHVFPTISGQRRAEDKYELTALPTP